MRLPEGIREEFRRFGRAGGRTRADRMTPDARSAVARRAAAARWVRVRFGASSFEALGLPGGDIVDAGLADLGAGRSTKESLVVSIAAPRLRREGVPIGAVETDAEDRLYQLLSATDGDLAHARYGAYLRRIASFADACRVARRDRG
jgi:hypothetical protein